MDPQELLAQREPHVAVERAQRLVEQQDARPVDQRPRHRDPLRLAARELRRVAAPRSCEPTSSSISATRGCAFGIGGALARARREAEPDVVGDVMCGNSA